jgi:hypothetical protein
MKKTCTPIRTFNKSLLGRIRATIADERFPSYELYNTFVEEIKSTVTEKTSPRLIEALTEALDKLEDRIP